MFVFNTWDYYIHGIIKNSVLNIVIISLIASIISIIISKHSIIISNLSIILSKILGMPTMY